MGRLFKQLYLKHSFRNSYILKRIILNKWLKCVLNKSEMLHLVYKDFNVRGFSSVYLPVLQFWANVFICDKYSM